ncbi:peptidylprolyl isomerase [Methanomassiliicoccus luminyensis]|uniref:peptidylprolyl isomerase n=1 Tax=Methanomassiliicoccus luminyensis TaxID=1080712 RepID=UPI000374592B|nr:peptidylprolyl isomerase [Methanomassiliicoccus luminyensis]
MSNEDTNQAAKVVKGDIVRIDFDGWTEDSNEIFDTTNAETAKDNGVYNEKLQYVPIPILVGGGRVFPGLDEALEGAEVGKEYDIVVPAEKAAGQRDPKLVEMLPLREFLKQEIEPHVGMEVNIRNRVGIITAVTAGRVRVDFNRRLAGKNLKYHFKVLSKTEGDEEKVKSILEMDYGTTEGFGITVDGKDVSIVLPDVGKYDQKWMLAKYRVVADLREALGALNVRFIEEYVKSAPAEVAEEAAPEEIAEEELPQEKQ